MFDILLRGMVLNEPRLTSVAAEEKKRKEKKGETPKDNPPASIYPSPDPRIAAADYGLSVSVMPPD